MRAQTVLLQDLALAVPLALCHQANTHPDSDVAADADIWRLKVVWILDRFLAHSFNILNIFLFFSLRKEQQAITGNLSKQPPTNQYSP